MFSKSAPKLGHLLALMLVASLFSSCTSGTKDCRESEPREIYTLEDCKALKKGDTVFMREYGHRYYKNAVVRNYANLGLVELKDLRSYRTIGVVTVNYEKLRCK